MGIILKRKKKSLFIVRVFYAISKVLPLSKKKKIKLFLNLEWIFDRLAHEYSFKLYSPNEHPIRLHTKKILLDFIKPEHTVLDLGCNQGDMSVYMADKAKQVVGVDSDRSSIELAQKKYAKDNLVFICSDAYEFLSNTNIRFDIMILSHILEHLDDPESFLKRYTPFFRYVYIELPDFDKTFLNHYRKDLQMPLVYTDIDHVSEYDRIELKAVLEKCGLQIITAEYIFGLQKIWCKV